MEIGKYSKTSIAIAYVKDIVDLTMVKSQKLLKINIDGIIDSYYLISFLKGRKPIFKQVGNYEKPDAQ